MVQHVVIFASSQAESSTEDIPYEDGFLITKNNITMTSSFLYKENLKDAEMVIEQMRSAGLNAMLCTESVPVSLQGVRCGSPTEIFDQEIDDYIMLPKSLVGLNPEMMIPVLGDSMIDAGYEEDDLLRVRFGAAYRDLDNVLVNIDDRLQSHRGE